MRSVREPMGARAASQGSRPPAAAGGALPDGLAGPPQPFPRADLESDAPAAARRLLGALVVRYEPCGGSVVARIVETEAYREDDPASHSCRGRTARTESMFGRAGTAYLYRSYGIHWCANVSVEADGTGAAVLLRAAAVVAGTDLVQARRSATSEAGMLRGPGNLAAGLDLDGPRHDGIDLIAGDDGVALLDDGWRPDAVDVIAGPRVGVSKAPDVAWRFHLAGLAHVSAYRRSPRARPPV